MVLSDRLWHNSFELVAQKVEGPKRNPNENDISSKK